MLRLQVFITQTKHPCPSRRSVVEPSKPELQRPGKKLGKNRKYHTALKQTFVPCCVSAPLEKKTNRITPPPRHATSFSSQKIAASHTSVCWINYQMRSWFGQNDYFQAHIFATWGQRAYFQNYIPIEGTMPRWIITTPNIEKAVRLWLKRTGGAERAQLGGYQSHCPLSLLLLRNIYPFFSISYCAFLQEKTRKSWRALLSLTTKGCCG